jgi:segregation and condensation protein A
MQSLSVDVAAEYLLMAATLAYLKSRELVPAPEPLEVGEDGEDELLDPREELIRRLLEYQKYKDAAERLGARPIEGKTIFGRGVDLRETDENAPLADHSVWKLIEAFARLLDKTGKKLTHEVLVDRVSIGARINQLIDKLELGGGSFRFDQCLDFELPEGELRSLVVVTILAVLELARLKVIRVLASDDGDTLFVTQVKGASLVAARAVEVTSAHEPEAKPETKQGEGKATGSLAPEAASRPSPARTPLFPTQPIFSAAAQPLPSSEASGSDLHRSAASAAAPTAGVSGPSEDGEEQRRLEEEALGHMEEALAQADSATIAAADALSSTPTTGTPATHTLHGETEEDV